MTEEGHEEALWPDGGVLNLDCVVPAVRLYTFTNSSNLK